MRDTEISDLVDEIRTAFQSVELGDEYTLLEEDFYDTGGLRRHFDQLGCDERGVYISPTLCIAFSEIEARIRCHFWPDLSQDIALEALHGRQRARNPFPRWQDVTFPYLNAHRAVGFLSVQAFKYYLPAAMLIFIDRYRQGFEAIFFQDFECTLLWRADDYIESFDRAQKDAIVRFLKYYSALPERYLTEDEAEIGIATYAT